MFKNCVRSNVRTEKNASTNQMELLSIIKLRNSHKPRLDILFYSRNTFSSMLLYRIRTNTMTIFKGSTSIRIETFFSRVFA